MRILMYSVLCSLAILAAAASGLAEALTAPTGDVILTVRGSIGRTTDGATARFDRTLLEAMPQATLVTWTPWTGDQPVTFEGVLARDVMAAVEARGTSALAIALNDYRMEIPLSDFEQYDVLLAMKKDGRPLRVREGGPLWIIYPLDPDEYERNPDKEAKMVWQLKELIIQ